VGASRDRGYATAEEGLSIAYEAVGAAPIDVIVVKVLQLPVDLMWTEPRFATFLDRLSSFCRHIWFDARGSGSSDSISSPSRIAENYVDDMIAVLDHLGVAQAVVLGLIPDAALFAATHPERVKALVLLNPWARARFAPDHPGGLSGPELDSWIAQVRAGWGTIPTLARLSPSVTSDPLFFDWAVRCERLAMPPKDGHRMMRAVADLDIRDVLASVHVPTLVISRGRAAVAGPDAVAMARDVAERIPGARLAVLGDEDYLFLGGDTGRLLDTIEEFVTGRLPAPETDRVLATVLFTDLVGSTEQAARSGDRRWRALLSTHDTVVGSELERFRGRRIKSTGDGVLATFDGPGRAIRCAQAIGAALQPSGFHVRAGVHTGEIELRGDDVAGIAVHIGARVAALAGPGEVLVSSSVPPLVIGSGIQFTDRGDHKLKGVPGVWRLFSVERQ
jgi:class 3 adenylate cyclase